MNSAFLGNGLVVEIAPGQVFDKPLEIVFVASAATEATMVQPRNLVVAGKGSQLQVLARYVAIGAQRTLTNVVTEVIVLMLPLDMNCNMNILLVIVLISIYF